MFRTLLAASLLAGCIAEADDTFGEAVDEATCTPTADVYSPYAASTSYPSGTVEELPWRGEDFEAYASPETVECASNKRRRAHLDVTAGCLTAVTLGDRYRRGRISSDTFRAVALGAKWTDQSIEYRFLYRTASGGGVNPGFKAFTRYRTEDDLYVASWRLDGIAQIQKKHCGRYTTLAWIPFAPPSPNTWHRLRFDAVDNTLILHLDSTPVLTASSATFSWGTAGIRIDGLPSAYLDDWHLPAP